MFEADLRYPIDQGRPEDGDTAVPLIYQTGARQNAYLFRGNDELFHKATMARWCAEGTDVSYQFAHVVRMDGQVAALLISYKGDVFAATREATDRVSLETLDKETLHHLVKTMPLINAAHPLVPSDAYYVNILSVNPDFQGHGLGRYLYSFACEEAQRLGCRTLQLDTFQDKAAVDFYRRMGARAEIETRVPRLAELTGVPGAFRFVHRFSKEG